jgi:hypothetical protein
MNDVRSPKCLPPRTNGHTLISWQTALTLRVLCELHTPFYVEIDAWTRARLLHR